MVEDIREMSDEELIELYKGLHDAVYVVECYGTSDYLLLLAVERELARRGYKIVPSFEIVKEDEEDEE